MRIENHQSCQMSYTAIAAFRASSFFFLLVCNAYMFSFLQNRGRVFQILC